MNLLSYLKPSQPREKTRQWVPYPSQAAQPLLILRFLLPAGRNAILTRVIEKTAQAKRLCYCSTCANCPVVCSNSNCACCLE